MAVSVTISDTAKARADALVSSGRYRSVEQAVEAGLWQLDSDWNDEEVILEDLSPADRAVVERGLADAEAGRVVDGEEFFAKLIAKYQAMVKAA